MYSRLTLLLLGTLLAACSSKPAARASDSTTTIGTETFVPLRLGDTLPVLRAVTLAGDSVRLGGASSPLTLVNVWATWCTSCREEMADLEALYTEFAPRGLRVVAVSVDEGDGARVRRFVEHAKLTFPVALDPENRVQLNYRVIGVPESYLVGTDGRLLWHRTGGIHGGTKEARDAVAKALGV